MATTINRLKVPGLDAINSTHTAIVSYTLASGAVTAAPFTVDPIGCTHIDSVFLTSGSTTASPTAAMYVRIKDTYDRDLLGGAASGVTVGGNVVMPTPDGSQKFPAQISGKVTLAPTGNTISGATFDIGINFTRS